MHLFTTLAFTFALLIPLIDSLPWPALLSPAIHPRFVPTPPATIAAAVAPSATPDASNAVYGCKTSFDCILSLNRLQQCNSTITDLTSDSGTQFFRNCTCDAGQDADMKPWKTSFNNCATCLDAANRSSTANSIVKQATRFCNPLILPNSTPHPLNATAMLVLAAAIQDALAQSSLLSVSAAGGPSTLTVIGTDILSLPGVPSASLHPGTVTGVAIVSASGTLPAPGRPVTTPVITIPTAPPAAVASFSGAGASASASASGGAGASGSGGTATETASAAKSAKETDALTTVAKSTSLSSSSSSSSAVETSVAAATTTGTKNGGVVGLGGDWEGWNTLGVIIGCIVLLQVLEG